MNNDDLLTDGMKTRRNLKTGKLEIYWEKDGEESNS